MQTQLTQVEQGKETADHLMPLGYWFLLINLQHKVGEVTGGY